MCPRMFNQNHFFCNVGHYCYVILVNLGYTASHALTAVSTAGGKLGGSVGLEELIRAALSELAPVIKDHG